MNPVKKQRLKQLDREIAALTAKRKAAEMSWLSATDPQQIRELKEVYEPPGRRSRTGVRIGATCSSCCLA